MRSKQKDKIRKIVAVAMFAALAYTVMVLIHFPVPPMLTLDVKDTVIALCGLTFGPVSALFVAVLVPFLELISFSKTGLYGFLMNSLGSAVFSVTVSLIYKYRKSFLGAVVGLLSGVLALTATMLLANLVITPIFLKMPVSAVRDMIPALLLPFNLVKAVLNASLVMLLYKPVTVLLRRTGFLPAATHTYPLGKRTVAVFLASAVLAVASLLVVFFVLDGSFQWGVRP